jgi:phosphonate transport system substrate-binding protein
MTAQMDGLKIIEKTAMVPRHLVSHRRGLSTPLVARLTTILVQMDQSNEGKKILQQFEGTTRFDSIPKESLSYLTKNVKFIEKELNLQ